jgi:hypothetical protein
VKNKTLAVLIASALGLASLNLHAAGTTKKPKITPWNVVISTCAWEEGEENLINTGTSDYQYNTGTTSYTNNSSLYPGQTKSNITKAKMLSVRCNITNTKGGLAPVAWNTLTVGYEDTDGNATNSNVEVDIYEIDPETGDATQTDPATGKNIPLVSFVSSSVLTTPSDYSGTSSVPVGNGTYYAANHAFDFTKYNYVLVSKLSSLTGDATNPDIWTARLDKY